VEAKGREQESWAMLINHSLYEYGRMRLLYILIAIPSTLFCVPPILFIMNYKTTHNTPIEIEVLLEDMGLDDGWMTNDHRSHGV